MKPLFRNFATAGMLAVSLNACLALAHPANVLFSPPPVPQNLEVPTGNTLFLKGEAKGTQNYVCVPSPEARNGVTFRLFTPQATLFLPLNFTGHEFTHQITTHFFSPNPEPLDKDVIRATWQSSFDTSSVWAATVPNGVSSDPNFVSPGAVAWLLLERKGSQRGPTGGENLSQTTFIQRLNTSGGLAPATGCTLPEHVGVTAFVPYTADYFFYKKTPNR